MIDIKEINPEEVLNDIENNVDIEKAKEVREIEISKIRQDFNDRVSEKLDEKNMKLVELATSIKEHGLLQPIVVKELPDGTYMKIAGRRRIEAFKLLGKERIPAVVFKDEDIKNNFVMYKMMLDENLKRKDLDLIDITHTRVKLIAIYFYKNYEKREDEIKDEEQLFQLGLGYLKVLKKLYNKIRNKTNLTKEEAEFWSMWIAFSEIFEMPKFSTFWEHLKLTVLVSPIKELFKQGVIDNIKFALKANDIKIKYGDEVWKQMVNEITKKSAEYASDKIDFKQYKQDVKQIIEKYLEDGDILKFENKKREKLKKIFEKSDETIKKLKKIKKIDFEKIDEEKQQELETLIETLNNKVEELLKVKGE